MNKIKEKLLSLKTKLIDIFIGFRDAYFSKEKWYKTANAEIRLRQCLRCLHRNGNKCGHCGCYIIPKAFCFTKTNGCPIGEWIESMTGGVEQLSADADILNKYGFMERIRTLAKIKPNYTSSEVLEAELINRFEISLVNKEHWDVLEALKRRYLYNVIINNEQLYSGRDARTRVIKGVNDVIEREGGEHF